ncbi:MAG: histidine phosphatase family protein [Betaproteobacteria bacterium]|nr:histidine phosphatase family protein [Betaproteobacteria bacterium]MBI2288855.1 histidine phosphatase family protein [Betaproteobacteria bacterium]
MTKVILVRHGQTSWNQSRRMQGGNNDTVLDEEGERQCRCLAERLKKENIKAVYSSPLSQAMGTAQWIADGHNLDVIEEPAFRECLVLAGCCQCQNALAPRASFPRTSGKFVVRAPLTQNDFELPLGNRAW